MSMLKRMIYQRLVLAGLMVVFTCLARSAEPLKIGMVAPLTGSAAESGRYKIQGAKLATEEVNKAAGVLGRPIELVIEDDQTTNPGVVLAFSKLAGDEDIPAFVGPWQEDASDLAGQGDGQAVGYPGCTYDHAYLYI
jgi:ABC-type branched-subunit amino acid transport system substrate-binding protein